MQRYFIDAENWTEYNVTLKDEAHHIIRVMRYEVGDAVICVHPTGKVARCEISELNETEPLVIATILDWLETDSELPVHVTILQSLPKGNKLDFIIQKATELGAAQFVLYESERSVVKWNAKKRNNRLQRYEKIAQEASEQSGRNIVPEVTFVDDVAKFIQDESLHKAAKLLAYEEEAKTSEHRSLYTELKNVQLGQEILIAIGPEGGFSENEVATFKTEGFIPVRLGKRILRTETAPLYALSSVSYHFEEMD